MAANSQQGSCRNIAGICAEGNGLDYISGAADASSCDKGYAVADALVPQPLIYGSQSQLHRNAHVIADSCGSGSGTSPETVDCDDVGAASGDSAGNRGDIMDGGDLDDDRLLVSGCFF